MAREIRPPEEVERLSAPPRRTRNLMAAHLQDHGIERFHLARHVYLGGERRPSQLLTWNPTNATFRCTDCPGRVFVTDELTTEMVRGAQLHDAGLKAHLAGLTEAVDRDEITRLYLAGTLNEERLRGMRAGAHRRATAGSRPSVDLRRKKFQAWLLEKYAELGVVEQVLDAAEDLQQADRTQWAELVGRPLARSTIKNYWYDIDPPLQTEAKRRFEAQGK